MVRWVPEWADKSWLFFFPCVSMGWWDGAGPAPFCKCLCVQFCTWSLDHVRLEPSSTCHIHRWMGFRFVLKEETGRWMGTKPWGRCRNLATWSNFSLGWMISHQLLTRVRLDMTIWWTQNEDKKRATQTQGFSLSHFKQNILEDLEVQSWGLADDEVMNHG